MGQLRARKLLVQILILDQVFQDRRAAENAFFSRPDISDFGADSIFDIGKMKPEFPRDRRGNGA